MPGKDKASWSLGILCLCWNSPGSKLPDEGSASAAEGLGPRSSEVIGCSAFARPGRWMVVADSVLVTLPPLQAMRYMVL